MKTGKQTNHILIYIAGGILILSSLLLIGLFLSLSHNPTGIRHDALTADTYMDIVTPLLINADAQHGKTLTEDYGCNVCHGKQANIPAPEHSELVIIAAKRRPPLTAAAYIYESIIYPGAYVTEGYKDVMPRIYRDEIPIEDLGDIIIYLLEGIPEA